MEAALSCKESILDKPEYSVYVERFQGLIWMHCDIRKWSHGIRKRLRKDWDEAFALLDSSVYAINQPHGCRKHQKFMESMGFKFFGKVEIDDEDIRYVYWRA